MKPRTPFLMIKEVIEKHGIKPIIGPKDYAQYEPIKIPMSVVGGWADLVRTQIKEFQPLYMIPEYSKL